MKPSGYMVFITPAKWQAKGGDLNDNFRKEIVPYMSKIVFYPDCSDIFNIAEHGGICFVSCRLYCNLAGAYGNSSYDRRW